MSSPDTTLSAPRTFKPYPQQRPLLKVWLAAVLVLIAFVVVPVFGNDYWLNAILIPFLVLSLAGLGLNLVTGYAGQLSLGSAAFMSVGAYATYNLLVRVPALPLAVDLLLGGLISAVVGALFGLPSLRIKGFYLIVSTLAAQFFVEWIFTRVSWFSNDDTSGVLSAPRLTAFGWKIDTPAARYLFVLGVTSVLFILAARLVRSELGRRWMAVRDMDTAARVIGIPIGRTKLLAFALSSFVTGIAGALWAFAYLGTVEPHGFDLNLSFQVLFIIIIGGMSSIGGNFLGAAFIVLLPILLSNAAGALATVGIEAGQLQNLQKILFGTLIIVFLIKEPDGLARLVQTVRNRLRDWPLRA
ncbi:ABC-type branched-chain amino acid transport system, permease component [Burkholderia sp. Ch1-1]|uniref:Branched-chain amino acid ABC transporter, permease protein n=1 Tax=Paraburkholderia dioscoreae TaxID=2604047 RepID=A0A5Q4Z3S9_9BURK|nr:MULTISPECIES: branched-chain amino acid ABC transporter permease [Paraburkholderia]EIF35116.1 ABC-type branched-chain amino acid transport system, permease component [Burkholderia sp. Ch1-1]MDR8396328.1 branched-chain amino acid ABC transporter permease [Paraburkholderia sp. USG1]VVD34316.1 branched-chain amino acid ABC transporter, permease protein [Paraburkholderia dioscoreae]